MSDLPALPVTFRPARTRAVLLTAGAAIFVVITTVAMLLEQLGPGERLSFVLTAALLLGVLMLLARPKVVAEETGVTVVNIAGRRRWTGRRSCRSTCVPATPGSSSTSATAPACRRSASSRASPSGAPSRTRGPCGRSPRPARPASPAGTGRTSGLTLGPSTLPRGPMS